MNTTKKNYLKGGAKEKKFDNGSSIINIDFLLSELQALPINERGYVKVTVSQLREPDKFGNTHSVYENDFKPSKSEKATVNSDFKKRPTDRLPF